MFRSSSFAALMVLIPLATQISVNAQVTHYTDKSAFTAASTNLSTIDFATANPNGAGTYTSYNTSSGLTLQGVNFVGSVSNGTNVLAAVDPNFYQTYQGWDGNPTVLTSGSNFDAFTRTITITLPNNTISVGTDLYTATVGDGFNNTVRDVTFTLSTGDTFVVNTFSKPTLAFAGFISQTPITSLTVTSPNGDGHYLSHFVFGQSAVVPAPGALTAFFMGAVPGAAVLLRRRRKA